MHGLIRQRYYPDFQYGAGRLSRPKSDRCAGRFRPLYFSCKVISIFCVYSDHWDQGLRRDAMNLSKEIGYPQTLLIINFGTDNPIDHPTKLVPHFIKVLPFLIISDDGWIGKTSKTTLQEVIYFNELHSHRIGGWADVFNTPSAYNLLEYYIIAGGVPPSLKIYVIMSCI